MIVPIVSQLAFASQAGVVAMTLAMLPGRMQLGANSPF
jgi:hypothetical protein